jgi:hypothetical protein
MYQCGIPEPLSFASLPGSFGQTLNHTWHEPFSTYAVEANAIMAAHVFHVTYLHACSKFHGSATTWPQEFPRTVADIFAVLASGVVASGHARWRFHGNPLPCHSEALLPCAGGLLLCKSIPPQ